MTDNSYVDMDELLCNNESEDEEEDDGIGRDKFEQLTQDKDKEDEAFLDHQIEESVQDERDLEEGEVMDRFNFKHTSKELKSCDQCNPHTNKIWHKKKWLKTLMAGTSIMKSMD